MNTDVKEKEVQSALYNLRKDLIGKIVVGRVDYNLEGDKTNEEIQYLLDSEFKAPRIFHSIDDAKAFLIENGYCEER